MTLVNNGYISDYLIHWAGRGKAPSEKARVLSQIVTTSRLLLSQNEFFFDGSLKIVEKMVCFTDVPFLHTEQHCAKYSNFGIAFHKSRLMIKGAQPVFYFTHIYKRDMGKIYRLILDQIDNPTLDSNVLEALHRHFYFMQSFSEVQDDNHYAFYYEREWRIGELSLIPRGESKGHWCLERGLPTTIGPLVNECNKIFFQFDEDDVAFLVVPSDHISRVENPRGYSVKSYESLVLPAEKGNRTTGWKATSGTARGTASEAPEP